MINDNIRIVKLFPDSLLWLKMSFYLILKEESMLLSFQARSFPYLVVGGKTFNQ
jgi:hypothetical protein